MRGIKPWLRFFLPVPLLRMQRWPSVSALAMASVDEVHRHWSGLGYYRRCCSLLLL